MVHHLLHTLILMMFTIWYYDTYSNGAHILDYVMQPPSGSSFQHIKREFTVIFQHHNSNNNNNKFEMNWIDSCHIRLVCLAPRPLKWWRLNGWWFRFLFLFLSRVQLECKLKHCYICEINGLWYPYNYCVGAKKLMVVAHSIWSSWNMIACWYVVRAGEYNIFMIVKFSIEKLPQSMWNFKSIEQSTLFSLWCVIHRAFVESSKHGNIEMDNNFVLFNDIFENVLLFMCSWCCYM